jgi:chemotaxis protein methyltransferase CheR
MQSSQMSDPNQLSENTPKENEYYLQRFNEYLTRHTGLTFNIERLAELKRGLKLAACEFGLDSAEACAAWLMESTLTKPQIEILSSYLTVGETFFFREKDSFDILEYNIIPGIIDEAGRGRRDRRLRIWSAACSSGEEAYSIATIVDRKRDRLKNWDIKILGTDINVKAIEKANNGSYSEWSLRIVPDWMRKAYFSLGENKTYQIIPRLKEMVSFEYLNLAEDVYPSIINNTSSMDIIFCRNVLMYFLEKKAELVVQRLHNALVDAGWLVVAPTDAFHLLNNDQFCKSNLGSSIFYKKRYKPEIKTAFAAQPGYKKITAASNQSLRKTTKTTKTTITTKETKTEKKAARKEKIITPMTDDVYRKALIHYKNGDYSETLRLLEETAEPEAHSSLSMKWQCKRSALIARAYANQGRLELAAEWCRKAIDANKLNPSSYYLQATILQEQGYTERAVKSLKKCLYIDQDYILAHFTLGNILFQSRDIKRSKKHLDEALKGLKKFEDEQVVSVEESLTAGRLKEIIVRILGKEM